MGARRPRCAATTDPVNAEFFGLVFTAALNPKLLGADLLIIENRRPRAMVICFLAGGLGMSITRMPRARAGRIGCSANTRCGSLIRGRSDCASFGVGFG